MSRKWYVLEKDHPEENRYTAGSKARDDVNCILDKMGFCGINIGSNNSSHGSLLTKIRCHIQVRDSLESSISHLLPGDWLFLQIPLENHSVFMPALFDKIKKRGIKTIGLVHDLERFRMSLSDSGRRSIERIRIRYEENLINKMDWLIVHNDRMIDKLIHLGFNRRVLVSIELFDYLITQGDSEKLSPKSLSKDMPVVIAGSLRQDKAGYVYRLPQKISFSLYGIGYEGKSDERINYKGVFQPDELPYILEGSFGLVWDGSSSVACEGAYGEYLKLNNPHKASLYFASGMPVITWDKSALSHFVKRNKCGFSVDSLSEICDRINMLSDSEYEEMKENACQIGEKVRKGWFLSNAINKIIC